MYTVVDIADIMNVSVVEVILSKHWAGVRCDGSGYFTPADAQLIIKQIKG